MNSAVEDGLKVEVISLQEKIQDISSERLRNTKQRRLEILEKRLKKFELAREKYLICETHLETIEDAIRFIYEQSMTMSNAEDVGFQLDNLLLEVEETSRLIEDLDQDILPGYDEFEADLNLENQDADAEKPAEKKIKENS